MVLSDKIFQRFSEFISDELGIKMPTGKRTMLQGRLMKRLRRLNMTSFDDYCDYIFSPEGKAQELVNMLDVVTTNKTDFFREPKHFEILTSGILPELARNHGAGTRRRLTMWSAGCSTGAEPYTLAMVLAEFAAGFEGFDFGIYATDISTKVLSKARDAVYTEKEAQPIPLSMKKKYLLRSRDKSRGLVRIVPALRKRVEFSRLNFMDSRYGLKVGMDMIFCRNVIIYFNRMTQEAVLKRLCRHLRAGGFLFTGHSETLNGFNLPLQQVTATVYRKKP